MWGDSFALERCLWVALDLTGDGAGSRSRSTCGWRGERRGADRERPRRLQSADGWVECGASARWRARRRAPTTSVRPRWSSPATRAPRDDHGAPRPRAAGDARAAARGLALDRRTTPEAEPGPAVLRHCFQPPTGGGCSSTGRTGSSGAGGDPTVTTPSAEANASWEVFFPRGGVVHADVARRATRRPAAQGTRCSFENNATSTALRSDSYATSVGSGTCAAALISPIDREALPRSPRAVSDSSAG